MNLADPFYNACAYFALCVVCPAIATLAIMACVPKKVKAFTGVIKKG